MKLTEHFTLEEFTCSNTAIKYGLKNEPNAEQIANLRALCENVLEPLRQHFNVPIVISSGFRCPAVNFHKEVRGVTNSQHMTGEAADIHIPDTATGNLWFEWMMDNLQFDQLIKERATPASKSFWIHVSFKRNASGAQGQTSRNRQQVKYITKNP